MTDKTVTMSRELALLKEASEWIKANSFGGSDAVDLWERLDAAIGATIVERERLSVWEGPMPESNGKSNFTVILHTGDLTEGICVYRSEYPDRARYEADCFRHLIGDPAFPEKPFICDYDADKHSGYVKPDASPPEPVAVVLPCRREASYYADGIYTAADLAAIWNAAIMATASMNACLDKVKEMNQ